MPHSQVIHARYAVDPARPWLGLGPLAWARHTASLAANLELRLSQEAGGPSGYVLPMPEPDTPEGDDDDPTTDPLTQIARAIGSLSGSTKLVPSTSGGWGGDMSDRPRQDWQAQRIGMDVPTTSASLRTESANPFWPRVVCPRRFSAMPMAPRKERAGRRFAMGPLAGLAAILEAELRDKLDADIRFDFAHMWAHDLAGRASSFQGEWSLPGCPLPRRPRWPASWPVTDTAKATGGAGKTRLDGEADGRCTRIPTKRPCERCGVLFM